MDNTFYAVAYYGGMYEEAFHAEKIFVTKKLAEEFFQKSLATATEENKEAGYSDSYDYIVFAKADVIDGCICPDYSNPLKSITWNHKTKSWDEEK